MTSHRIGSAWQWLRQLRAPTHMHVPLALLAVGALLAGWFWCRTRNVARPVTYKTAVIQRGDILQSVTANGALSALKTITVGSQVSGIITDIKVDYNAHVTNGQIIAQIDPSTLQQQLNQATAELANAQAAQQLAELKFRRARELRASQLISQADYDEANVNLQQARAAVQTKQANVNKSKVDIERTVIYSPIDGIVISRAVDVGQTVAASLNAPTLFTIAQDLRHMRIEAAVSEADVGGVEEGQPVRFSVDAFPNRQFTGRVTRVRYEASVSQNVVHYTTIVEVDNDDLKLRPGMTANTLIITAERRNVLRVPNAALRFRPSSSPTSNGPAEVKSDSSSHPVYLVRADGSGVGALQPVNVRLGISDGTWTEVMEGLNENDRVAAGAAVAQVKTAAMTGTSPFGGGMPPPPK
jgi:HlyD family secretion protein